MNKFVVVGCLFLVGCGATLNMPTPVAYPGACPQEDYKCQRNADAQTLAYIGEPEAAASLMCTDPAIAVHMGAGCNVLPAIY